MESGSADVARRARGPAVRRLGFVLAAVAGLSLWACSPGAPVLCTAGLPDGGCAWHVEVHCGGGPVCSPGSTQVLDAGSCVRDTAADVIGCS